MAEMRGLARRVANLCGVAALRSALPNSSLVAEARVGRADQQVRRRRARVLMADAALAEVAGPALERLQRDRRFHALLGRLLRAAQSVLERRVLGRGGAERLHGRKQRIEHRLVAGLRLPALLHAGDAGLQ